MSSVMNENFHRTVEHAVLFQVVIRKVSTVTTVFTKAVASFSRHISLVLGTGVIIISTESWTIERPTIVRNTF